MQKGIWIQDEIGSYSIATEFQFGKIKLLWRQMVMMVEQQCECSVVNFTRLFIFKQLKWSVCVMYVTKKITLSEGSFLNLGNPLWLWTLFLEFSKDSPTFLR